jgi:hypothetical protein
MTIFVVDAHETYQRGLNIEQVAREGISAIIFKASEGSTGFTAGPTTMDWVKRARSSGMIPGAYHWLTNTSTEGQLNHYLEVLQRMGGPEGMLCAVDVEDVRTPATPANVSSFHDLWLKRVGNQPLILYTGGWWWRKYGGYISDRYPYLWDSRYVQATGLKPATGYVMVPPKWWNPGYGGWTSSTMIQFTDSGLVAGQRVDVSAFCGDIGSLRSLTTASPNHTTEIKETTEGGEDSVFLARVNETNSVILTNGVVGRWVGSEPELADVVFLAGEGKIRLDGGSIPRVVGRRELCGTIVGAWPPDWGVDDRPGMRLEAEIDYSKLATEIINTFMRKGGAE